MELIRPAIATDCDAILSLIKELAVFEKMPDQVEMTTATLIKDGFEADPKFSCLVAEINEAIVAYALYYPTYSTWKVLRPFFCRLKLRKHDTCSG